MICTQCKWHDNEYGVNAAKFHGNPDADIVFIGEAYGKSEAQSYAETGLHRPFIGKAGHKFEELLGYANLTRRNVAIMNSQRCYHKGNPTPTKSEMDACFLHTLRDLQKIKPKLVVAMGGAALYQTTGKTGITHYRGRLLWSDKINCKVFCTFHPAAAIYDKDKWTDVVNDFLSIPKVIDADPTKVKLYPYMYINNVDDFFESAFPVLKAADELFFDLETTGLDPWRNRVTILILGTDINNIFIIDASIIPALHDELKLLFDTKPVVGQGYEFDAKFLDVHYDLFPEKWGHNTMLAEFVLTGAKSNSLTFLTGKYDPDAYGYDDAVKELGGAHKVKDINMLCQYACNDVGVMVPIAEEQHKQLVRKELDEVLYKITIPCSKVLTKMSIRGVRYDILQLDKANRKYEALAQSALKRALKLKKVKACENHFKARFNPKSSNHIRWLMTDKDGYNLPVLKKTKSQKASVTKVEMKIYAKKQKNPYARIMEDYRSYEGVQANFLSGVKTKNLIIEDNNAYGAAHTTYKLHVAATGRPTSSQPNLQNIPNDDDIKAVYVARPGYIYVYADLSQIEVRVAAMLSQDPTLMRACNTDGVDFHSVIASEINGYSYDEFYGRVQEKDPRFKTMRNNAKTTTFGVMYGMGAFGLSYRLGISVEEAEEFIEHYFRKMPQVKTFMEGIKNHVIQYGWVATYFGFRRYFANHTEEDHGTIREAQNHPIQGTAWNLMQLILIQLDNNLAGSDSHLVMQTYDSAVIEVREEDLEQVAPMMKRTMEGVCLPYPKLNTVVVKTDVEVGYNLRDLKSYEVLG